MLNTETSTPRAERVGAWATACAVVVLVAVRLPDVMEDDSVLRLFAWWSVPLALAAAVLPRAHRRGLCPTPLLALAWFGVGLLSLRTLLRLGTLVV